MYNLYASGPRFASLMIATWGEIYRKSIPPEIILDLICHWIEHEPMIIYQPIIQKSMVWTSSLKPMHVTETAKYISICGLPDAIGNSLKTAYAYSF